MQRKWAEVNTDFVSLGCEIQLEVWYFELLNFPGSLASFITAGPGKRRQASLSGIWYRCSSISYRNTTCFPLITAFALPFVTLKRSWMAFRRYTTELHWQLTVRSVTRSYQNCSIPVAFYLLIFTQLNWEITVSSCLFVQPCAENKNCNFVILHTVSASSVSMLDYIANNIADVGVSWKQRPLRPQNSKTKTSHIFQSSEITTSRSRRSLMRLKVERWRQEFWGYI